MTQKDALINYLNDFGTITPMEAFKDLGITKLATLVSRMRRQGYEFEIEKVVTTNRYGNPCWYCKYTLESYEGKEI